jgi:hypothetical protein
MQALGLSLDLEDVLRCALAIHVSLLLGWLVA